ncbi:MAG TPA: Maf family protein [Pseudolabrys sp.]|jgi:septum formation protein|nr:Maf family protein [Pseudolabrys sp.]
MPVWLAAQPLVLASKSDVRGKMLAAAGLRFEIRPAQIDERALEATAGRLDPAAAARLLAWKKAEAVAAMLPGRLVLGADQTLAGGNKRFSKPADRAAAAAQLRELRGRTHQLNSALALVRGSEVLFQCIDAAQLTMRDVSERFIEDYLDMAGEAALSSVGAYQLEGLGVHLFERVQGDYFTILGLPLLPLLAFLRREGFIAG